MRLVVAILSALAAPLLLANDDCSFDPAHQVRVLTAIAQSAPGAVLDIDNREVVWRTAGSGVTAFSYGGCADLGSMASHSMPTNTPRTRAQVFAVAKDLAERFWSNEHVTAYSATRALLAGLAAETFEVEQLNGATVYEVRDPGYVVLYVEHAYADGVDRVTIAWQGNF